MGRMCIGSLFLGDLICLRGAGEDQSRQGGSAGVDEAASAIGHVL
jgi:hypothetical protein